MRVCSARVSIVAVARIDAFTGRCQRNCMAADPAFYREFLRTAAERRHRLAALGDRVRHEAETARRTASRLRQEAAQATDRAQAIRRSTEARLTRLRPLC